MHGQGAFDSFDKILTNFASEATAGISASEGLSPTAAAAVRVRALLTAAYLNSHSTKLEQNPKTKQWSTVGNMSEGQPPHRIHACLHACMHAEREWREAVCGDILRVCYSAAGSLVVVAAKAGLTPEVHKLYPREAALEVPFNSARKMAMSVHALPAANVFAGIQLQQGDKKYTHIAVVKGAPDRVSAETASRRNS